MFAYSQRKALNDYRWSVPPLGVKYIEAFRYSTEISATSWNLRQGSLQESDLESWLEQRAPQYDPPTPSRPEAKLTGGIRLIFAEREFYKPPSFPFSRYAWLRIDEVFRLAPTTLEALSSGIGSFSRFIEYEDDGSSAVRSVSIVFKVHQKYQVGNSGLSYYYDCDTGMSTGIIHGTGLLNLKNQHEMWSTLLFDEFFERITSVHNLWSHPLLLSALFVQHYVTRVNAFCRSQFNDMMLNIQEQLGVSRAGRLNRRAFQDPVGETSIQEARTNLQNLTSEMSTFSTELIRYIDVSETLALAIDSTLKTIKEMDDAKLIGSDELIECLTYNRTLIEAVRRYCASDRSVVDTEFNVLYSIISQIDNRLNAKMSALTNRDSIAMKALSFVTILFLPATAVASIFSMTMFDWQADIVVTSNFWVYWAVVAPLTLALMLLLRIWWSWEKRSLDEDVRLEVENASKPRNSGSETPPRTTDVKNETLGGLLRGKYALGIRR